MYWSEAPAPDKCSVHPLPASTPRRDSGNGCTTQGTLGTLVGPKLKHFRTAVRSRPSPYNVLHLPWDWLAILRQMTKTCPRCNTSKDRGEFGTRPNGYAQSYCLKCHSEYGKNYYKANVAAHNKRRHKNNTRKRKELKAWLDTLKALPCTDCKVRYPPYVMQFDHLKDKFLEISAMATGAYSQNRILEELQKCELVCANCHAERTHQRDVAQSGRACALGAQGRTFESSHPD